MNKLIKTGFIVGRFQPFHKGHLSYLEEALSMFRLVYVGITNPDPSVIKEESEDDHRHKKDANIFYYYERKLMIQNSLPEINAEYNRVEIVPFSIHTPDRLRYYIPVSATGFIRVFDEWDEKKLTILDRAGYKNLKRKNLKESDRDASGTDIRSLIKENGKWQSQVPMGTKEVIEKNYPLTDRFI